MDAFELARLRLAQLRLDGQHGDESVLEASRRAAAISAHTLLAERVGIWLFEAHNLRLRCVWQYTLSTRSGAETNASLDSETMPSYLEAMNNRRTVVVDVESGDAIAEEMRKSYLQPNKISAMLDAPMYFEGEIIGVVCHEHVGPPRRWSDDERAFAAAVADMLALIHAQRLHQRLRLRLHEQELKQQQRERFAALGHLAAGVAHDLGNLLMRLSERVHEINDARDDPQAVEAHTATLRQVLDHGGKLAHQLAELGSGRTSPGNRNCVDQTLREMEALLTNVLGPLHPIAFYLNAGVAEVGCASTRIQQIAMNLALNAKDALSDGGVIEVETRLADPLDSAGNEARLVELVVRDQGVGMPPEIASRACEPYFTSKGDGRGHGLGLTMVQQVAVELGGDLTIVSNPGIGTQIRVRIPIVSDV